MTNLTRGMSWPRPRQLVDTRQDRSPFLNLYRLLMRWSCINPAWRGSASIWTFPRLSVRASTLAFVLQKMRHLLGLPLLSQETLMIASRSFSNLSTPWPSTSTFCSMVRQAASRSPPTRMWTGSTPAVVLVQCSRAICCTSVGHVAENISICRSGRTWLMISPICSPKPWLSISSASSSTMYVTRFRFVHCSFRSWMKRPGVAMTMSFFSCSA
mmetsp:Transcript_100304/g.284148  ORF Transcript_100304/g.284148 Transcript_100304/m.284148 type:complete len:213 (-) Transcript_100304:984-1622(-)